MSTGSVSDAEPAREEAPVAASSASEDILASHSAPTQPEEDAPNETDTAPVDDHAHQQTPYRSGDSSDDNERAWKIYRERVKDIDEDLLEGWNDNLNALLIFGGLFSAVCTAFVVEMSKNLQPDWQRETSLAVFAIYTRLNSTSLAPFELPNPVSFTPPTDARLISGLWLTSLTLSLAVSFLAILAKQWLNEFKSRMRAIAPSPKLWAMRHSAYKSGLERWGMDAFISTLPLLLHAAFYLFLTGLCLRLLKLDGYIAAVIIAMTAILSAFYVAAGLAPLFWGIRNAHAAPHFFPLE